MSAVLLTNGLTHFVKYVHYSPSSTAFFYSTEIKRRKGSIQLKSNGTGRVRSDSDIISPPDELTKLRRVKLFVTPTETEIEKEFRLELEKVQDWNEKFWREHNSRFIKESKAFQQGRLQTCADGKKSFSSEEMSEFYKAYLDKNWSRHVWYNFMWYWKNSYLVYLAWRVQIIKLKSVFRSKGV